MPSSSATWSAVIRRGTPTSVASVGDRLAWSTRTTAGLVTDGLGTLQALRPGHHRRSGDPHRQPASGDERAAGRTAAPWPLETFAWVSHASYIETRGVKGASGSCRATRTVTSPPGSSGPSRRCGARLVGATRPPTTGPPDQPGQLARPPSTAAAARRARRLRSTRSHGRLSTEEATVGELVRLDLDVLPFASREPPDDGGLTPTRRASSAVEMSSAGGRPSDALRSPAMSICAEAAAWLANRPRQGSGLAPHASKNAAVTSPARMPSWPAHDVGQPSQTTFGLEIIRLHPLGGSPR